MIKEMTKEMIKMFKEMSKEMHQSGTKEMIATLSLIYLHAISLVGLCSHCGTKEMMQPLSNGTCMPSLWSDFAAPKR